MNCVLTFLRETLSDLPNKTTKKLLVDVSLPYFFFISVCFFSLISIIIVLFCQNHPQEFKEKDLKKVLEDWATEDFSAEKTRSRTHLSLTDETSILLANDAGFRSDFLGSFILHKEISREKSVYANALSSKF